MKELLILCISCLLVPIHSGAQEAEKTDTLKASVITSENASRSLDNGLVRLDSTKLLTMPVLFGSTDVIKVL